MIRAFHRSVLRSIHASGNVTCVCNQSPGTSSQSVPLLIGKLRTAHVFLTDAKYLTKDQWTAENEAFYTSIGRISNPTASRDLEEYVDGLGYLRWFHDSKDVDKRCERLPLNVQDFVLDETVDHHPEDSSTVLVENHMKQANEWIHIVNRLINTDDFSRARDVRLFSNVN